MLECWRSHEATFWCPAVLLSTVCVVMSSATANGPEKLALKGYLEADLFVATRDNPIDKSAGKWSLGISPLRI